MKYEGQVCEPGDIWRSPLGEMCELVNIGSAGDCIEGARNKRISEVLDEHKNEHKGEPPTQGLGAATSREREQRKLEVIRMNQPVRKLPAGE